MALFVPLDANWPDHSKMLRAGLDGAGLHATALCLAKRQETDGWIDRLLLLRYGASDDLIQRLIDLALLDVDGDLLRPHGWHDRNPSQGAIDATRAAKIEAARLGNHNRWNHPGALGDCPKCAPMPTSSHGAIAPESHRNALGVGCDRPEPEPESLPKPEPEPPPTAAGGGSAAQPTDQDHRAAANAVGRAIADRAAGVPASKLAAYATGATRRILQGDDPTDRDRIMDELRSGRTGPEIADGWHRLDLGADRPAQPSAQKLNDWTGAADQVEAVDRALALGNVRALRTVIRPSEAS